MKKLLLGMAALLTSALALTQAPAARAETIYLKSGAKIIGRVIEDKPDSLKVEVAVEGGIAVLTLHRDKIDRIEKATTFDERLAIAERWLEDNSAGAETRLRDLVREDPRHVGARIGLARALTKLGRDSEALKTMEHYFALVQDRRDPAALLYYAELLMYRGDYRDARKWARDASALEPQNAKVREQSDALVRRIERMRDGTEAAEVRAAASRAEIDARIKERAAWDKATGTNLDAQQAGEELRLWAQQGGNNVVESTNIRLTAADRAEGAYARGGDVADYRKTVTVVTATIIVNETQWLAPYDHQKRILMNGWFYQLRERYPASVPVIQVQKMDKDRQGRPQPVDIARGLYDGRKERLVVDLWTPPNVDPTRPRVIRQPR